MICHVLKKKFFFEEIGLKSANYQFFIYTSVFFRMKKKANIIPTPTIGIRYKSIFTAGGSSKPGGGGS